MIQQDMFTGRSPCLCCRESCKKYCGNDLKSKVKCLNRCLTVQDTFKCHLLYINSAFYLAYIICKGNHSKGILRKLSISNVTQSRWAHLLHFKRPNWGSAANRRFFLCPVLTVGCTVIGLNSFQHNHMLHWIISMPLLPQSQETLMLANATKQICLYPFFTVSIRKSFLYFCALPSWLSVQQIESSSLSDLGTMVMQWVQQGFKHWPFLEYKAQPITHVYCFLYFKGFHI